MLRIPFWHVCYIKQKSEKIVQKKIEELHIEAFLPLVKHVKLYKTSKKIVFLPLFPGYIFVRIEPGYRHQITAISEVYRFIKFRDEYAKVANEEIENLQLLVENIKDYREIQLEAIFQQGKNVEVTDGPFQGMKGKMIKRNGRRRIIIEMDAIKQYISVEIDSKNLRILESQSTAKVLV